MTFSIVAFDPDNRRPGGGGRVEVPMRRARWCRGRGPASAPSPRSRGRTRRSDPDGLALMGRGMRGRGGPRRLLVEADEGRDDRQVGFVDARGGAATFTGSTCMDWAGGATGDGFAAQGNILVGEPSGRRAGACLRGDRRGPLRSAPGRARSPATRPVGDRRGRQSAALLVVREGGGYEGRNDRYIDLRVDDHPDAPAELARLFEVWDDTMLIRNDPLLPGDPELVADLQRRLAGARGYLGEPSTGASTTRRARRSRSGPGGATSRVGCATTTRSRSRWSCELRDVTPGDRRPA